MAKRRKNTHPDLPRPGSAVKSVRNQTQFGKNTECIIYRIFFLKSGSVYRIVIGTKRRFEVECIPEQILKCKLKKKQVVDREREQCN